MVNLSPAIPSKIYRSVTDKCVVQYETEEEQHQVRLALPRLAQISRTLRRHNAKAKPQILNVRVIKAADPKAPDIKAYNKPWPRDIITLREGANEDNFFIVFEESRETHAPMIIFSDMVGLWTLWKADHISCDGNFKYVPHLPHKFLEVSNIFLSYFLQLILIFKLTFKF